MRIDRLIQLIETEKACVCRNRDGLCNRNCAGCDLVQEDTELIEAYDSIRQILEKLKKGRA